MIFVIIFVTHKLLFENDPWKKVNEGRICGKERGDHGAVQDLQGLDVQVVGQDGH